MQGSAYGSQPCHRRLRSDAGDEQVQTTLLAAWEALPCKLARQLLCWEQQGMAHRSHKS